MSPYSLLCALGLATGYVLGLPVWRDWVGDHVLVGSPGVVIGLYAGAHPAAFSIDLIYLWRSAEQNSAPPWPAWILQGLALFLAWLTITLGAIQLGG